MSKLLSIGLLLLSSATAQAGAMQDWLLKQFAGSPKDYGSWLCSSCSVPRPGGSFSTTIVDADMKAFIEANNDAIHADERVQRWIPNSQITICDGTSCITLYYQASTVLWLPRASKPPVADKNNGKYKNSTAPVSVTPPGAHKITVTFQGPAPVPGGVFAVRAIPNVPVVVNPYAPVAPARTITVVVGPMIVVGTPSDYTSSYGSGLGAELGSDGPNVSDWYGGGGGCGPNTCGKPALE